MARHSMTFSATALAILVVFPMLAALGVTFLAKKKLGSVAAFVMGGATLGGTGWLVLNLGVQI